MADFVDTFTESVDTNLASHTPDTGTGWTLIRGNAADLVVDAASDRLRADNAPGAQSIVHSDDFGSLHYEVEGRYGDLPPAGTFFAAWAVSLVSDSTYIGIRMQTNGSDGLRWINRDSGSATVLKTQQGAADTWYKIVANGDNTFDWYLGGNGTEPSYGSSDFTYDDSVGQVFTSTKPGVINEGSDNHLFITEYRASDLSGVAVVVPTRMLMGVGK